MRRKGRLLFAQDLDFGKFRIFVYLELVDGTGYDTSVTTFNDDSHFYPNSRATSILPHSREPISFLRRVNSGDVSLPRPVALALHVFTNGAVSTISTPPSSLLQVQPTVIARALAQLPNAQMPFYGIATR
jgi:hypothetical protein